MLQAFLPPGYFKTHDGDFHLVRLYHFVNEINRGQFPVRVAQDLAYGYGYPVFNYFYPLPYLAGSVFALAGLPLGESLKVVVALSTVISAIACFYWLRGHTKGANWPAFVGTVLSMLAPYRLASLYVTGQVGTILAFAWIPLLLLSIFQVITKERRIFIPIGALAIAGLILSHINTLIIFSPLIAVYTLILMWQTGVKKTTLLSLTGLGLLGLGIASFYLLPSLLEKNLVRMGDTVFVRYEDHWPTVKQLLYSPWGYGFSQTGPVDGMSFQLGLATWLGLGVASLLSLPWLLKLKTARAVALQEVALPLAILGVTLGSLVLMLPVSNAVWQIAFPIQYLQYPWRWLSLSVVATALVITLMLKGKRGYLLGVILLALAFFNTRNYLRSWENTRYPDSHYLQDWTLMNASTDISWENLPVGVTEIPSKPAENLVMGEELTIPAKTRQFTTEFATETPLTLNLFAFPYWEVTANGQKLPTTTSETGLLQFVVPAGKQELEIKIGSTPLASTSNLLTFLSLLLCGSLLFYESYTIFQQTRNRHRPHPTRHGR